MIIAFEPVHRISTNTYTNTNTNLKQEEWSKRVPLTSHVHFDLEHQPIIDVYTHEEYERRGDFDPSSAAAMWELEEEEEKERQLLVRPD